MRTKDTARVLPRRSRLTAKARRVGDESLREHIALERLVTIQVRDRHLGRRNEVEVLAPHTVEIFLELGELSRAGHGCRMHEQRWPHLFVAVLARMQVDEEREQ